LLHSAATCSILWSAFSNQHFNHQSAFYSCQ